MSNTQSGQSPQIAPTIKFPALGQQRSSVPFNITMLNLEDPSILSGVKKVSALDSFEGATLDFHSEGLFSTEIFGRVGDERRSLLFGYIDIKAEILHPIVYTSILKLKRFYGDLIAGHKYAVWDENLKDFIPSKQVEGARTGYAFFLEHWKNIHFVETGSIQRAHMIKMVKMYSELALTSKVIVMPASYRDMEIDENGRRSEHEINDLYRRLIRLSNTIIESSLKVNPEKIDRVRFGMQRTFCAIYDMIEDMVKGKKKLFLGKFASRRIAGGTRNVITAMNTAVADLDAPGNPDINSTIIGLYQYLQANLPLSVFHVSKFLENSFPDVNVPAKLVDPKTLKSKEIYLSSKMYDRWTTKEGIEKVIASFKEESIRKVPLLVEGNYLGLVYEGPDNTFRFFQDIDELPHDRLRQHVRPATLLDILYLSVYKFSNNYPIYVTRYPITGVGSVYPSMVHLRTTVKHSRRVPLNQYWEPIPTEIAYEYPDINSALLNSLVPHSKNLKRLGADFDGDTSSGNICFTDEAIREVKDFLKTKRAYVGADGKLLYSTAVDTVEIVFWNMTGDPISETPVVQVSPPAIANVVTPKEPPKPATENYSEGSGSIVTHNGAQYSVDKLIELTKDELPTRTPIAHLEWMRDSVQDLDSARVAAADDEIPLIALMDGSWADKKVVVLDGAHRVAKLFQKKATSANIRYVPSNKLHLALVE